MYLMGVIYLTDCIFAVIPVDRLMDAHPMTHGLSIDGAGSRNRKQTFCAGQPAFMRD